ncbi:MAG TPA: M48 family metallopeptidase [Gammaproteobacteria bacterium]|nr:M48 family metallopeptidase [Gammaproteobacteria bacterium]
MNKFLSASLLAALAAACATSPTGRRQLDLVSDQQAAQAGNQPFQQIKKQTPVDQNPAANAYAGCIVHGLSAATGAPRGGGNWVVTVFKDDKTVNAFALPGGHVSVYTGIFKVAKTPGELAAVLGHEMGHVQAGHGAERISDQEAASVGVDLAALLAGIDQSSSQGQATMAALGAGATVGVLLPYSRAQESEADKLGTQYMAEAGWNPHEALELWRNMMSSNQGAPPALLSDHPADATRLQDLQAQLPDDMQRYQKAQQQGHHPDCTPPGA